MRVTIFLIFLLGFYFLPTIIAYYRGSQYTLTIFIVNVILGWTVIGWFVFLIWAFFVQNHYEPVDNDYVIIENHLPQPKEDYLDKIEKLKRLLDKGALTIDEYNEEKRKLLNKQ